MPTILLMKNKSDDNVVSKNLEVLRTVEGQFRDNIDIMNPSILIELDALPDCNYIYIPAFSRYYFVTTIRAVRNGIFDFSGHVDVLQTYGNQIRELDALVAKQENNFNLYLNDGTFKTYQNPIVTQRAFPNAFTGSSYILTMSGG